ncbi:MAG: ABC transporter ATP-binding protein [Candidatus Moranbacteria bacterium]|nr:ABC transporter ATP-binding protein [Candidatus Moranbacteria bacterium]NTW90279.1 ABC transporter ATP-binding protein [Candidatus Moranbacteria bacterium]
MTDEPTNITEMTSVGTRDAAPIFPRANDPIITVRDVFKSFHVGPQLITVLKDISFDVERSDFLIVFGPSGCGKSTLLHILLGLEGPSTGEISFLGENLYLPERLEDFRSEFRKRHIGMVYQQSNWIKSLTVIENISFPLLLLGWSKEEALRRGKEALESVKLGEWSDYHPMDLSSGQQQRVAIARAIITDPEVIIADEPTGNLDYEAGENLLKLLRNLNEEGKTIIMVTHDLEYLSYAKTALSMRDGRVLGIFRGEEKHDLERNIHSKRGVVTEDMGEQSDFPEADL